LIPVDELERYLAERRQEVGAALRRPARPGRKSGLDSELVARIRSEYAKNQQRCGVLRYRKRSVHCANRLLRSVVLRFDG
jgi:hypothetical protein